MFEGRRSFTHMLNPRYEEIAKLMAFLTMW
mgnify:FL=1